MSFFSNFFLDSGSEKKEFWIDIQSEKDISDILNASEKNVAVLYKHSTRCIISKTVLRNFEKEVLKINPSGIHFYYLDLLSYKDISNKISENTGVPHQSPQIIVIKNRKAIFHSSHDNISFEKILTL